jgi:hypothetical protein
MITAIMPRCLVGNATRYRIARLKRDHPALAEALARIIVILIPLDSELALL